MNCLCDKTEAKALHAPPPRAGREGRVIAAGVATTLTLLAILIFGV